MSQPIKHHPDARRVGIIFGVSIACIIDDLVTFLDTVFGLGLMDEYFIHYLPSEVQPGDLWQIAAASIGITLIASVYPAIRAATTDPVEILQYDG